MISLFLNTSIAFLADTGLLLCMLITVFMTNRTLGLIAIGLYVIKQIAEYLLRKELQAKLNQGKSL